MTDIGNATAGKREPLVVRVNQNNRTTQAAATTTTTTIGCGMPTATDDVL
jgi:hypothetical protein